MSFSIGDTVDAYRILGELGRGGMGQVFKVEHTLTKRLEAMKVLEGGRPDAPEQAARSLREIQVQARLDHPHIATVHHAFWSGGDLILVMELIEGCSLRALLERGRLPVGTAIDYACQALAALGCAHSRGVIHRDVSPSNMMVSSKGVLKLTDFGLSKGPTDLQLSRQGAPIGSLYYMPPEQVRGTGPADVQSDIYSMGAVLYELATGRRPFDGDSAYVIMVAQVEEQPVAPIELVPSMAPGLSQAILRALAKDPAERFSSAEEFRQALLEFKATVRVSRPLADRVARPFTKMPDWRLAASGPMLRVARTARMGLARIAEVRLPTIPKTLDLRAAMARLSLARLRLAQLPLAQLPLAQLRLAQLRLPTIAGLRLPTIADLRRSWALGIAAALALTTVGVASFPHHAWRHHTNNPPVPAAVHPREAQPQKPSAPLSVQPQQVLSRPAQNKAAAAQEKAAVARAVTKKSAPAPDTTVAAVKEEPAAVPDPPVKHFEPKQLDERPVAQIPEQQLVLPEAPPAIPLTEPLPRVAIKTDVEVAPAPRTGSNGLKTGIGKLWHLMRGKKSASENDSSTQPSERP